MKVVIAVATENALLRAYCASERDKIVPPEVRSSGYFKDKGTNFSVLLYSITHATSPHDLDQWLRGIAPKDDSGGLILFVDAEKRHLAADFEDAYFVVNISPFYGRVLQNQVRSMVAPVLRHFAAYSLRFDSLNNQRVLLLPFDVFQAAHLAALRLRMTVDKMMAGFGGDLDTLIAALMDRARPKTRKSYRTVYIVDDRPLWYRYGPDKHKYIQTDVPPHPDKCWHNSVFRFGRRYTDRLHHNVDDDSQPTKVYGTFYNCHGVAFTATGESHLGIFPNGFI
jgi:hypothetical protein